MISINKQGNAIVIEFTDNDKYLFNGKIEVAPNELIVVTDDSEMATFKKASNGDVLFSQLISDIQIAGSPVTKDTIIDQFATIGFISGEGAVSSVNGQTGEVVITADSLNVYNKTEIDTALNGKQDSLVSGINIKTINGNSILGSGNVEITGGGSSNKTWYFTEASDFLTNETVSKGRIPVAKGTISYGEVSVGDKVILDNDYYFVVLNKYANPYKYIVIMPIYNPFNHSNVLGYVMEVPDTAVASVQIFKVTTPVDTTMSDTSENAVQNKVIKTYVDGLVGDINSVLTRING